MPWSMLGQSPEDGSLEVYRTVIEGAPVMLWLGDASGKCLLLNRQQRIFWGVGIEEVPEFDWVTTLHPEDLEVLAEPFQAAMQNHTELQVEARYQRFDGVWRVLQTSASPRFAADGRFLGMVGVNVDVTEQREAEAELLTAQDSLALATQASHLGWGAWDYVTGATTWNPRARAILDLDENAGCIADWIGKVVAEDQEEMRAEVRRRAKDKRPFNMIYRIRWRDGSERHVQSTGSIEFASDGTPLRGTGLVRDVTEQWREQEFQKLVIGELNHRVKNLLGLVNALVLQTSTDGRSAAEYQSILRGRLQALAATSNLTVDSESETVELRSLIETVLEPHRTDQPDVVRL